MDREGISLRAAEQHETRHEVRPPAGQHAGEAPAAAVAYDRRPPALALDQVLEACFQPVDGHA